MNYIKLSSIKIYNIFLSLVTVLNCYSFFISNGISIAMIFTSIYSVYGVSMFIRDRSKHFYNSIRIELFYVLFIIIFISCFSIVLSNSTGYDIKGIIYEILKLLVWSTVITFCGFYLFNYPLFFSYMKKVVFISFIFLCIQYILRNIFHVSLPNGINLGIIVPFTQGYASRIFEANSFGFRPSSIWVEPSFLGYYYNCFLLLILLDNNVAKRQLGQNKNMYIAISCLGNLMSYSTSAIGIMLIIILFAMYNNNKKNAFKCAFTLFFTILIPILVFYNISHLNLGRDINKNINYSLYKLNHLGTNTRTGGSFHMLDALNTEQKLFGFGVGNIKRYLKEQGGWYTNSIVTIILWIGYVGLFLFLLVMCIILKKQQGNNVSFSLLFLYLIYGLFAGSYFGPVGILYLTIVLYQYKTCGKDWW